jgi:hypothetical protein
MDSLEEKAGYLRDTFNWIHLVRNHPAWMSRLEERNQPIGELYDTKKVAELNDECRVYWLQHKLPTHSASSYRIEECVWVYTDDEIDWENIARSADYTLPEDYPKSNLASSLI